MKELVIKISDEVYEKIANSNPEYSDDFELYYAIKNSTPLSKAHTLLEDIKKIKQIYDNEPNDGEAFSQIGEILEKYDNHISEK